jgi:hypothetical protein
MLFAVDGIRRVINLQMVDGANPHTKENSSTEKAPEER